MYFTASPSFIAEIFTSYFCSFDCGTGPAIITSNNTVKLGEWNTIAAYRKDSDGSLTLNNGSTQHGRSKVIRLCYTRGIIVEYNRVQGGWGGGGGGVKMLVGGWGRGCDSFIAPVFALAEMPFWYYNNEGG